MPDDTTAPLLLGPPPASLIRLLDQGSPFVPPTRALVGLSAQDACRRVDGAPHTIAEIVAHVRFWQDFTHALLRGEAPTPPEHAAGGWPPTGPDDWDALRADFLAGVKEFQRLVFEVDLARPVRPGESLGYELVLHVTHNAVHLGQVIQLRQMLGAWPPPGGGDTW